MVQGRARTIRPPSTFAIIKESCREHNPGRRLLTALKKTDVVTSERPFDKSKSLQGNSPQVVTATDEMDGREDKYIPGLLMMMMGSGAAYTMDVAKVKGL